MLDFTFNSKITKEFYKTLKNEKSNTRVGNKNNK